MNVKLFSPPRGPDRCWGPSWLLSNGTTGSFPTDKMGWGMKLTTHLQVVPRSIICGSIHHVSPCGGGLLTSTVTLRIEEGDEKGTRCLGGVQLDDPVTGGHKYRDLGLHDVGWTQEWKSCSVKKKWLSRNTKKWKPDSIWQNSEEGYGSERAVLPMVINDISFLQTPSWHSV
jgi:hypothetical protein